MLHKVKPVAWMPIVLICFTGIAGIAWQNNPVKHHRTNVQQDTIPKREKIKDDETIINGDLNKAMEQVKKAHANLEKQLQNKDWEKMQKNLLKAQAELNTQNIQEQVEKAMKEIDMEKIQLQAQEALQKIDWEKMQKDLQKAEAEIKNNFDSKKMEASLQRSMEETKKAMAELKTVDMEKIQEEQEKTKATLKNNQGHMQEELENAKKEINKNLQRDLRKELENARAGIDRATEELQQYKNMLDEMYKDGLLNSKEEYSIEYKKGDLFINGTKLPESTTNKYKHYFKKENVTIKRSKGDDEGL